MNRRTKCEYIWNGQKEMFRSLKYVACWKQEASKQEASKIKEEGIDEAKHTRRMFENHNFRINTLVRLKSTNIANYLHVASFSFFYGPD